MSRKTPMQKRARALQEQTGWSYMECLRLVQTKTEDEIDRVIDERAKAPPEVSCRPPRREAGQFARRGCES